MDATKPWYLSRTIWAALVTVASTVAGMAGLPAAALDDAALTELILQLVGAVSGILAIFGRLSATNRIG